MATTRDFDKHLRMTSADRFSGGSGIDAPVTVAFGSREALIPERARRRDELPPDTRWIELPGCGHIPFWDAPDLVAEVILEGTERLDPPTIDGDAPGGPFANHGETDAIAGLSRGKNG